MTQPLFPVLRRCVAVVLAALALAAGLCGPSRAEGPVLLVEDRAILERLEARGYGFGGLFGLPEARDLEGLHDASAAYRDMVGRIGADVAELRAEMKQGGRTLFEVTDGNVGRIIDMRWLRSDAASFDLVGVVNRLDRRDFAALQSGSGCGEVRLIYRLAYAFRKNGRGRLLASRLPFNINAVFDVTPDADGGCQGVAGRLTPALEEALDAGWLSGGMLDATKLKPRQIELNAQVVRFPSGLETEFGGQAAYLMRIFGIEEDQVIEVPLENTIDPQAIAQDAALLTELETFVRENVAAIDSGVYAVPQHLLARKVVSYSTFGSARQANRPFATLFGDDAFSGLDFSGTRLVRSSPTLIARLDNGSCQGCHQAGSTAGFHFIGIDADDTSPLNRIEVGISPHLDAELARREAYVAAVAEDREPDRFRPLSTAPRGEWGSGKVAYAEATAAMPCMMSDEAAGYRQTWACGGGTVCTPMAAASDGRFKLAQCLLPEGSDQMYSGHPCLQGEIATNQSQPFNDRMKITGQFAAFAPSISRNDYTCRPPRIGVPGGLAYRGCTDRDRAFADFKAGNPMPREICGLAGGKAFDLCVATNNFDQCLGGAVVRGNRPSCSADRFCREDYICQQFPPDTPGLAKVKGVGFCSPTYFVFQMRIDNHTTPWASRTLAPTAAGVGQDEEVR